MKQSYEVTPKLLENFWSKVNKSGTCWIWKNFKTKSGYGTFGITKNIRVYAHRFSYEVTKGMIPEGLTLDHLCRNRNCINPDHLEPVTCRTNILRGESMMSKRAKQTHCKNGHELKDGNLYKNKKNPNRRYCLTCKNQSNIDYKLKKKQEIK